MSLTILTKMFLAPCSHTLVLGLLKMGIFLPPNPYPSIFIPPSQWLVISWLICAQLGYGSPTASFEPYSFKQKKSSKYRTPECRTTFLGTFCLMASGNLFKVMKALYFSHMISCSVSVTSSVYRTLGVQSNRLCLV